MKKLLMQVAEINPLEPPSISLTSSVPIAKASLCIVPKIKPSYVETEWKKTLESLGFPAQG